MTDSAFSNTKNKASSGRWHDPEMLITYGMVVVAMVPALIAIALRAV
jgi:hypothetical protein